MKPVYRMLSQKGGRLSMPSQKGGRLSLMLNLARRATTKRVQRMTGRII
jgi:hypothetical protein